MTSLKNEIIDLIHKTIERKIFDETNMDVSFNELGIDSIENMNIIFEIQEKYKLERISDEEYDKLKTLTMIEEYINKVINS
tara:strand:+ start:1823 stop:2065 length:243 start_codon:yes stop_codon:yes gene_type:complete